RACLLRTPNRPILEAGAAARRGVRRRAAAAEPSMPVSSSRPSWRCSPEPGTFPGSTIPRDFTRTLAAFLGGQGRPERGRQGLGGRSRIVLHLLADALRVHRLGTATVITQSRRGGGIDGCGCG